MSPSPILPLVRYGQVLGRTLAAAEVELRAVLRAEGVSQESFAEADAVFRAALVGREGTSFRAAFVAALLEARADADRTQPGGAVFEGPVLPFRPTRP
jgi:hypothetical protein